MAVREGTYKSLLQGVSQQTPQERADGQLGSQLNMLSDPVTALRRRGGIKLHAVLEDLDKSSYIRMTEILGDTYITVIDTAKGSLSVYTFDGGLKSTIQNDYFKARSKSSIRTTVSKDNFFILNTELIPTKQLEAEAGKNPKHYGYFSIVSTAFSKVFTISVTHPSIGTITKTVTASSDNAAEASQENIARGLADLFSQDTTFAAVFNVHRTGITVAFEVKDKTQTGTTVVDSTTGVTYVVKSGASRVVNKAELLGTLPSVLDGYIMAVGNVGNSAYYKFDHGALRWAETGVYEPNYKLINEPMYWYLDAADTVKLVPLGIKPREAGDDDNNPDPKFIGYGLTGIGSYQSRLVLLSGSYVNMSQTRYFNQFMRTTVTELLDDDAIEVSSSALSSAQFEYCVPYNKDLVLIAQTQQAVIPANSTVLTPKSAVIYPSTKVDLSLAAEPQVVARSLYYTYQRGADYYQVGEFIPNTYTDAQYYNQNLTDHVPLYATGVCTCIAASTTNNMVVMSSDSRDVLVNQFLWVGEDRPLMSFHKWEYPLPVVYAQFIQEYLIVFMDDGQGNLVIGTQNVQLNQLDDKPIPFLDLYGYVTIENGVGVLPEYLLEMKPDDMELAASIYNDRYLRHQEIEFSYDDEGNVTCPYDGVIYVGVRFTSEFTLTPPFIKDENGKVVAGAKSTVVRLDMEFKNTGTFKVSVKDTMGDSYYNELDTALTWSEADLGYTWVNSIGQVSIPCRTRLTSTQCSVETVGTTDLNLTNCNYLLRLNQKHRRI
ncbi:putative tail tubular protein B [Acinetobacter phage vB_AbaP_Acibel007]|uniref:Putative tail tubular protein B n=1 Tax=Acinetobacter phage vB_AbaP_Acibel007 TaxID=1481187 RepID=A0A075DXX3_9CAUD|nr:tail protein [Acinetobacter phage vB_AbaP_Acibel007]AHY26813.1 putative tail tubular protein B [Acinetobacter phage vB_AbaP_Acibel007]